MDQEPLVIQETDAAADFIRRLEKYVPVRTAFWLKQSDEHYWYLYVAPDSDTDDAGASYGDVLRAASESDDPYFDAFRVKLIRTSDPLAQAALDIQVRYPSNVATRLGAMNFGGITIDGAFIYPVLTNSPAR
jgi:hypothetical protein